MRLPVSLIWFALTGVIFLLQAFPWTGIFLMFLLAPFWSVVTVNLGFISLAIEALIGKTSRLWLLAPVIWFGGYALFTFESHRAIDQVDREIRQHNLGQSVAFAPADQALVFADENGDLSGAPSTFINRNGLLVAFVENRREVQRKLRVGEVPKVEVAQHFATRLGAGEVCSRFKSDKRLNAAGVYVSYIVPARAGLEMRKVAGADQRGLCTYRVPEDPMLPIVRVAAKSSVKKHWTHSATTTDVTISAPDGRQVNLKAGHGAAYTWLPMPVAGCWLNSGAPSWNCEVGFMKDRARGLGAEGLYGSATLAVLTAALKLEERPATERIGEIEAVGAIPIETALAKIEARAVANLDLVLTEPQLKANYDDFKGLIERPDILAPRAEAMILAMSGALDAGNGQSETVRQVQRLIAALAQPDFARVGPALVEALERERVVPKSRKKPRPLDIDPALLVRLGDLGEVGLPVLEPRALGAGEKASADAILGLCRAGPVAAHLADPLALAIEAVRLGQDAHRAGVVALLRFGRVDLVETMIAAAKTGALHPVETTKPTRRPHGIDRQVKDYEAWVGVVGPNSAATVCQHNPLKP
jgi:hypothetical protein